MKKEPHAFDRETELLYKGGQVDLTGSYPESPGIFMTTAYVLEDLDALSHAQQSGGYMYSRTQSPNHACLEELLSYLEKGEAADVCASGMSAIFCTLLSLVRSGGHILANSDIYGETYDLLANVLPEYGVETTFLDLNDQDALEAAIRPNTKLLYTEIITNPLTSVVDLELCSEVAHRHGIKVAVDNTFTPCLITPLTHGADVVIHSLTKYINGHFDVTGGAIISNLELMKRIRRYVTLFGPMLGPMEAWLALRGARTAELRTAKQFSNAAAVAKALEGHQKILRVYHPSLESHPQHELASRLFQGGYGAMLSFALEDSREAVNRFVKALKLIQFVPTLGGYKTTITHPASTSHRTVEKSVRLKMGIHDGLIRMSVGMERPEDLISDISQALDAV